jgi:hypothetical protein
MSHAGRCQYGARKVAKVRQNQRKLLILFAKFTSRPHAALIAQNVKIRIITVKLSEISFGAIVSKSEPGIARKCGC